MLRTQCYWWRGLTLTWTLALWYRPTICPMKRGCELFKTICSRGSIYVSTARKGLWQVRGSRNRSFESWHDMTSRRRPYLQITKLHLIRIIKPYCKLEKNSYTIAVHHTFYLQKRGAYSTEDSPEGGILQTPAKSRSQFNRWDEKLLVRTNTQWGSDLGNVY